MQCRPIQTARESNLYQRGTETAFAVEKQLKIFSCGCCDVLLRKELAKPPRGNELHTFHEFQSHCYQ